MKSQSLRYQVNDSNVKRRKELLKDLASQSLRYQVNDSNKEVLLWQLMFQIVAIPSLSGQ